MAPGGEEWQAARLAVRPSWLGSRRPYGRRWEHRGKQGGGEVELDPRQKPVTRAMAARG